MVQENVDPQAKPAPPASFVLGQGDEVSITVWRNDELNRTVKIDPSGSIYLPLAGQIQAQGLAIPELREVVASRLSKYLVNPQVNISLSALRSQNIYVLGEVASPGTISLDKKMLVWESIAMSGGFTDDANQQNVILIRTVKNQTTVTNLNLQIGQKIEDDSQRNAFQLQNMDIVYVAPRTIAKVETFLKRFNNLIAPFISLERAIVLGPQMIDALQGETGGDVIVPP
ncbi:polysaccharide biosynthesis/export family protein [Verrucomicrobiota bacterium]